jgi:hypothetical protein
MDEHVMWTEYPKTGQDDPDIWWHSQNNCKHTTNIGSPYLILPERCFTLIQQILQAWMAWPV